MSDATVGTRHRTDIAESPTHGDEAPPAPKRSSGGWNRHLVWLLPLLIVALLGQMSVAMVTAAREQSPVIDEVIYVGAAVVYPTRHDLQINPEHPPLSKLLSAVGLAFADVRLDPTFQGNQMQIGLRVLYLSLIHI